MRLSSGISTNSSFTWPRRCQSVMLHFGRFLGTMWTPQWGMRFLKECTGRRRVWMSTHLIYYKKWLSLGALSQRTQSQIPFRFGEVLGMGMGGNVFLQVGIAFQSLHCRGLIKAYFSFSCNQDIGGAQVWPRVGLMVTENVCGAQKSFSMSFDFKIMFNLTDGGKRQWC